MGEHWQPLFEPLQRAHMEGLHEGVPSWIIKDVSQWLYFALTEESPLTNRRLTKVASIRRACRLLRLEVGQVHLEADDFVNYVSNDERRMLEAANLVLSTEDQEMAEFMELILSEGGSAWRVAGDEETGYRLERRLDEATVAATERLVSNAGRAGEHLANAWTHLYSMTANPSEAHDQAVKAVEAVARPIILPRDNRATLGKMIRAVEDKPAKWRVVLAENEGHGLDAALAMMRALWKGQHDRHGTDDDSAPLSVSHAEAEAALYLAIALVRWFSSDTFQRAELDG